MKHSQKFLITTALEETWESNQPVIFLGEWCKIYNRKEIYKQMDYITLEDPLSNRFVRENNFNYITNVYEQTLLLLSKRLNEFFSRNHSVSFWRVLIGPWLRMYLNRTNHLWQCLELLNKQYQISNTVILDYNENDFISFDTADFESRIISDSWNHYILSKMIFKSDIPYVKIKPKIINKQNSKLTTTKSLFSQMQIIFSKIIRRLKRCSSAFIFNAYIGKKLYFLFSIKLKQLPINWENLFFDQKKVEFNSDLRGSKLEMNFDTSRYISWLSNNILQSIPTVFLESFQESYNAILTNESWPECPKFILTAAQQWSNDPFKMYAAIQIEKDVPFFLICHGGGGKTKYSDFLNHDFDICDKYFTWGWSEYNKDKCFQGFNVKSNRGKIKNDKKGKLLLITYSEFRYQKFLSSFPSYEQFINNYVSDQCKFINELETISKSIEVRLHFNNENFFKERLKSDFKNISFSHIGVESLINEFKKSRLIVSTYNCTTIVELMSLNLPTVIFWNPEHWELVESAKKYFELLTKAKVFFNSPVDAARHILEVWENIDSWWFSEDVQSAREAFKNWFGRTTDEPLSELLQFIEQ